VRAAALLIALTTAVGVGAADYGTARTASSGGVVLRISDRLPLCAPNAVGCIETALGGDVWSVADRDRIVIDWGEAQAIGPVVARTRHLYIPIDPLVGAATPAPVTVDIVIVNDAVDLIVSQDGDRHRLRVEHDAWVELPLSDRTHRLYARLEAD